MQYLLDSNDFGNIWLNTPNVWQFHKVFKTRLNDQFIKEWQSAISSSSRFFVRRELSLAFQLAEYINAIRNPDIRLIYTKLRTDLNVLSTCHASEKQSRMCPMCNTESETVSHFVLHCPYFSIERNNFHDCINPYSPYCWPNNESRKLSYILDLCCSPPTPFDIVVNILKVYSLGPNACPHVFAAKLWFCECCWYMCVLYGFCSFWNCALVLLCQ